MGKLTDEFFAHLGRGRGAGHDEAGGGGHDQGRNGGHQAVTDGQQGIGGGRVAPGHVFLHHADDDAAHDIDDGDENTGIDVALHKLARAVHGAVKVGFLADAFALGLGFVFINEPGVEVGLNGHLLAGHGVQGKAGRHFGDTRGTGGDDHFIEQKENTEDHDTNHIAAADNELAKGLDYVAGGVGAFVPVQQNQTGGSHVEGQAQQSGHQQQGRENGKFQGREHEHGGDQHDERQGNADGQHDVHEERGQGYEHHKQDDHHARGQQHVALFGEPLVIYLGNKSFCFISHNFDTPCALRS